MLFDDQNHTAPRLNALVAQRGERSARELQDERDRLLATGRLRRAAEMTAWIDEALAEAGALAAAPKAESA